MNKALKEIREKTRNISIDMNIKRTDKERIAAILHDTSELFSKIHKIADKALKKEEMSWLKKRRKLRLVEDIARDEAKVKLYKGFCSGEHTSFERDELVRAFENLAALKVRYEFLYS